MVMGEKLTEEKMKRSNGKSDTTGHLVTAAWVVVWISVAVATTAYAATEKEPTGGQAAGEAREHVDGQVEVSPDILPQLGIKTLAAGPGTITVSVALTGRISPLEDRVSHVTPRYPGVIREVRKRLGDAVARGEVVAVVENNQTLQPYEVRSQIPGTVVRRHATIGEAVTDTTTLYEVADYSDVFAEFSVFPGEYSRVKTGQKVVLRCPDQPEVAQSVISFLSPVTDPDTQSRIVRAVLPNPNGLYQPGMFVTGDVVFEEASVSVAVDASAVRTRDGADVVFVQTGDAKFVARPVLVGRRDKDRVEILKGLTDGERYAAGNTFVLLAELGKGEAEHDD